MEKFEKKFKSFIKESVSDEDFFLDYHFDLGIDPGSIFFGDTSEGSEFIKYWFPRYAYENIFGRDDFQQRFDDLEARDSLSQRFSPKKMLERKGIDFVLDFFSPENIEKYAGGRILWIEALQSLADYISDTTSMERVAADNKFRNLYEDWDYSITVNSETELEDFLSNTGASPEDIGKEISNMKDSGYNPESGEPLQIPLSWGAYPEIKDGKVYINYGPNDYSYISDAGLEDYEIYYNWPEDFYGKIEISPTEDIYDQLSEAFSAIHKFYSKF